MTVDTSGLGIGLSAADLDRIVEEQLNEVRVAGQTYRFRPETRCRVCRNADLRERVEDLLAVGTTYREILAIIHPSNSQRARRDQISYHSIFNHVENNHFPIAKAAQGVYRKIQERHAAKFEQNFVKGVGHTVTIMAVLETVLVKGYAAIVDERVPITPELAISAGLKLHELLAKDSGAAQAAEMIARVSRLQEAVFAVCTPEQIRQIELALDPPSDAIDAEWDSEDAEDDEDDEAFDPDTDLDGGYDRDDES